ncbi:MAG TPA: hypothetical protein VED59_08170 [Acidimicrobiales bacterium]|nr:hypothetical protein [Acidimicrobiales bacterium]
MKPADLARRLIQTPGFLSVLYVPLGRFTPPAVGRVFELASHLWCARVHNLALIAVAMGCAAVPDSCMLRRPLRKMPHRH